jgi:hypothetical protein
MPHDGTWCTGAKPRRMVNGKVRHPVSPGFRRGLFVPLARQKTRPVIRTPKNPAGHPHAKKTRPVIRTPKKPAGHPHAKKTRS